MSGVPAGSTGEPSRAGRSLPARVACATLAGLTGPIRLGLRHRNLLWILVRRDVQVRTSGTVLGGVWMIAQPALQMLAFWFLLDFVLRVRFPGHVPFVAYFLVGMLPWLMMAEVLTRNLNVLTEFSSLYERATFPVAILPLVPVVVSGGVYGAVYLGLVLFTEGPLAMLLAPVIIVALLVWVVPLGYLLAVLGLLVRDLRQFVPFLLVLTMYLTPILYTPQMLPAVAQPWLVLNPFADIMAVIHWLLQDMAITPGNVLRPLALWLVVLGPAWVLFRRAEPHIREQL